mmetsp:Transcript_20921/g.42455  ORF Transcript_20921/g.42455 Transcript_20921/m.42455 type:complete len:221 (-) Transcript_20921:576-1238(-)
MPSMSAVGRPTSPRPSPRSACHHGQRSMCGSSSSSVLDTRAAHHAAAAETPRVAAAANGRSGSVNGQSGSVNGRGSNGRSSSVGRSKSVDNLGVNAAGWVRHPSPRSSGCASGCASGRAPSPRPHSARRPPACGRCGEPLYSARDGVSVTPGVAASAAATVVNSGVVTTPSDRAFAPGTASADSSLLFPADYSSQVRHRSHGFYRCTGNRVRVTEYRVTG